MKARQGTETGEPEVVRAASERLEEAVGLALAIELEVVHSIIAPIANLRPATLFGTGKVEEIAGIVSAMEAGLVIVDHALTPIQQRNLEKAWNAKVLDRTGLILEIFGRRAATKEGTLQVELAHLNYQRGRLVRSWTHLERQRGGAGFLGGPGETQIEADRRILRDKIKSLENELEQVRRTRSLHRAKRKKVPLPIIAFVGYTNAGKSTLFNRITGAEVVAKDMLFATLDPTLRRIKLAGGTQAVLSDTVGFVSDLPTHLVAAFRATLEEVREADIIVHVHDVSHSQAAAQANDVDVVMADLGIEGERADAVIHVWNKIDLLPAENRDMIVGRAERDENAVALSAITGEGIDSFLTLVEERISGTLVRRRVSLPPSRFADVAWLYENGIVDSRQVTDDGTMIVDVRVTHDTDQFMASHLPAGSVSTLKAS
ncbi:MAG: GTPase HflX [Pseudomonadota bacterium]